MLSIAILTDLKKFKKILLIKDFLATDKKTKALSIKKEFDAVKNYFKGQEVEILVIAARMEAEIAELESEEDKMEFLKDVGMTNC